MTHFCPQCGQPVTAPDATQCHYCGASLTPASDAAAPALSPSEAAPPAAYAPAPAWPPGAPPPLPQLPPIPFEAAPGIGSFFATVKAILTHPIDTLQGQRTGEGLFSALAFYLIIQIPAQLLGGLWNWALHRLMPQQPTPPGLPDGIANFLEMIQHPSLPFAMAMAAGGIILGLPLLFLFAAIIHAFLRLLGGGKEGYGVTVKALCYCHAPLLLAILPLCGGVIGALWALILQFVLVGAAHREPPTKGVLAVLFYYLLVGCCTVIAIFGAVFAIAGSIGALAGH